MNGYRYIPWEVEPVSGSLKAFVLPLALVEAGLLTKCPWEKLEQNATEKWEKSVEMLFLDLARRRITKKVIDTRAKGLGIFSI